MLKELIGKVVTGENLTRQEAEGAMELIMAGEATPAQIGALLTALRLKGETVEEITGFALTMRRLATAVPCSDPNVVDTCGTGGDGTNTFNISTTAALVLAGAGVRVAKHGNRSVSSRCGSADVLEQLGVHLDLGPDDLARCLEDVGIAFLYAPALHGAMKHAAGPRREIGFRTVFNILGPLTNPAGARVQVLGVYDPALVDKVAAVLNSLESRRAFVVHGAGGMDEVSPSGPALICELKGSALQTYKLDPRELGIEMAPLKALAGGSPETNAAITKFVLEGNHGPCRDAVLLNTALGLVAAGLAPAMEEALGLAARSIDSGAAGEKLIQLAEFTNRAAGRLVVGL